MNSINLNSGVNLNSSKAGLHVEIKRAYNYKPAFRGKLGDAYVAKVIQGEKVDVANVINSISGTFGPKKEKTVDVIESLITGLYKFVGLNKENTAAINSAKQELSAVPDRIRVAVSTKEEELYNSFRSVIAEKDRVIAQKDEEISNLKKYEGMAKVKSLDEIGLVMPEQVLSTLEDMKAHDEEAHKSLYEYVMTGKGQESFLKQMERNNLLLKAWKDGIYDIPNVKNAADKAREEGFSFGYNASLVAYRMLENILLIENNGAYLMSPKIYQQVKTNAESLISPMKESNIYEDIDKVLQRVLDFHNKLDGAMKKASEKGLTYQSETKNGISTTQSFRTFIDKDGNTHDFSLSSLASGMWGASRIKNPAGVVTRDWSGLK